MADRIVHEKGTAMFKPNIAEYIAWFESLDIDAAEALKKKIRDEYAFKEEENSYNSRNNNTAPPRRWTISTADSMLYVSRWASHPPEERKEAKWPRQRKEWADKIRNFISFSDEYSISIKVGYWQEGLVAYIYLGNHRTGIVIYEPEKWLEYIPEADYSSLTVDDAARTLCGDTAEPIDAGIVPADARTHLTTGSLTTKLDEQTKLIEDTKKKYEDTQRCETEELAEMKAKIDKLQRELNEKKWALMEELEQKLEEFEEKKFELESQIFLLDSQIYSIRCYAGETVKFTAIRTGEKAPKNEPIIVHQKLRFLDEELGALASIYQIDWDDISMFEHFLRHHPLALDVFAPNDRCVSLVRLSRTGTILAENDELPFQNLLKEYNYYHGKTVGIIIRNGDNLYLGWTDEDRVHIKDDFIVTQNQIITETTPYEEPKFRFKSDKEKYIRQQRQDKHELMDGIVSRLFVYNILQGVIDHTPMLPLPEGVKLNKQSEYVIYSVADKWLTDNRYDFNEIVARCNERVLEGDMLLTTQRLIAERRESWSGGYTSQSWHNARGIGDKNRTHDVVVGDCTIYPANLVNYDKPVMMTKYKYPSDRYVNTPTGTKIEKTWISSETTNSPENLSKDCVILGQYEYTRRHVFVSEEKEDSAMRAKWDGNKVARANFELRDEEFINLTYMNSVWLEWVVTNRKLGGWRIAGHEVDYSHAIRYLKTALDHVHKREEEEKTFIDAVNPEICKDREWPLKLTEWKMANKVRSITPFQAKRFAKAMAANS